MYTDFILIGVDGGATKTTACQVDFRPQENRFYLTENTSSMPYRAMDEFQPDFSPVDLKTQLEEKDDKIHLTEQEHIQGRALVQANVAVIRNVIQNVTAKPVLVGIGFPGLKTADGRGISAMANGPRMPEFLQALETELQNNGIEFVTPVARIGSDADYCGLGEEYGHTGLFAPVTNAYYLGGGTGAADALKLRGHLLPFDRVKAWLAKTWELMNTSGISMERYASAGGIQWLYSTYANVSVQDLQKQKVYPSQILSEAINGSPAAIDTFHDVATNLALLIFERISTVYFGWMDLLEFMNPNREPLTKEHEYLGTVLDRIVIGQRLGELLQQSRGSEILWQDLKGNLSQLVTGISGLDSTFVNYYCPNGQFDMNLISISSLREAPALGAAVDAYLHWSKVT